MNSLWRLVVKRGGPVPRYTIRAELIGREASGEAVLDTSVTRRVDDLHLRTTTITAGRVQVSLTIDGTDLWVAMLACMGMLNHNSFDVVTWNAHVAQD